MLLLDKQGGAFTTIYLILHLPFFPSSSIYKRNKLKEQPVSPRFLNNECSGLETELFSPEFKALTSLIIDFTFSTYSLGQTYSKLLLFIKMFREITFMILYKCLTILFIFLIKILCLKFYLFF